MSARPVLAADVGGTNLRLASVDTAGRIAQDARRPWSPQAMNNDALLAALADAMRPLIEASRPAAIGVGFPGFVSNGRVAASPNLPGIRDLPLKDALEAALGLPVAVENDALCAAIGEHAFGAGKGCDHLLHLTLGTGIGAGLILNGAPWRGAHGMAMEFGHLIVDRSPEAARCGCGNRGCVETLASASAVLRRWNEQAAPARRVTGAAAVAALARQGDARASRILAQAGAALGAAIAEAAKLIDVGTVSLGGGLGGAWPLFIEALEQALDRALIPPLRGRIAVVESRLGDDAGLLGAARLAA